MLGEAREGFIEKVKFEYSLEGIVKALRCEEREKVFQIDETVCKMHGDMTAHQ